MVIPVPLNSWFLYSDINRSPYNPTVGTIITTDQFWRKAHGDPNSPNWLCEEWLVRSALVPIEKINTAVAKIYYPNEIFDVGWDSENNFNFGENSQLEGIELYPLFFSRKHPITNSLIIELSPRFVTYHCLDKRNKTQYYHLLENIIVAETDIDSHDFYDPTPKITVHRNYLRDFLAAIKMGLLISVVADRSANAHTEDELGIEQGENKQVDDFTWLSTTIHSSEFTGHGYFCGRSILRRNFIIEPYDKPRVENSPWPYFGEILIQKDELPRFTVDSEGKRQTLADFNQQNLFQPRYLYFRPEVLQKYLQTDGYSVYFHMRNWGGASPPAGSSIDVGINSHGLVNAFAPDIADLSIAEQAYWASFSSLPSGEVCEEMFETRMQCNPPSSPGVTELIHDARSQLNTVFVEKFSVELYTSFELRAQDLRKLSVGPINRQYSEVLELAEILYKWVIEPIQIDPLRTALGGQTKENKDWRQIKLLEKLLGAKGLDEKQARSSTAPLAGLNQLRIGATHIGSPQWEQAFKLMGVQPVPQPPRAAWNWCVDAIAQCLNSIANTLKA